MLDVSICLNGKLFVNFGSIRNSRFDFNSETSDLINAQTACDDFCIDCPIPATEHDILARRYFNA